MPLGVEFAGDRYCGRAAAMSDSSFPVPHDFKLFSPTYLSRLIGRKRNRPKPSKSLLWLIFFRALGLIAVFTPDSISQAASHT
jgi:hypothetical protein